MRCFSDHTYIFVIFLYPSFPVFPSVYAYALLRLVSSHIRHSMIVPIYQSEISPANHRGKLACIEFTGNIIGYASSIWIDYACSFMTSDWSWRVPLGIQCVGGAVLAAGTWVTPESPRWVLILLLFPSLCYSFQSLVLVRASSL